MTAAASPSSRAVGIGVLQLLSGRVAGAGLTFLGWATIGRTLGPEGFGDLSYILAVFVYVGFLADLGLTTLGTRELSRGTPERLLHQLVGARLGLAILSAGTLAVASWIAPQPHPIGPVVIVLSLSLLPAALSATWILRARVRSAVLGALDAAGGAAFLLAALVLVREDGDVVEAALATTAGLWLAAALSWALLRREQPTRPELSAGSLAQIRRALPLGVSSLAIAVYYGADWILLGLIRSTEEVGLYAAAYRLVLPWLTVAGLFGAVALPSVSRLLHDEPGELQPLLHSSARALLTLALPVAVGTTIVAEPLVVAVFGEGYLAAAAPLTILIWTCVTVYANAPFGYLMLARRRDRAYMWIAIGGAVLNVAVNLLLIPLFGTTGAAWATLLADATVMGLILWSTRDVAFGSLLPPLKRILPAVAIMGAAIWPFRESLVAIPVGIGVYGVLAVVLGLVSVGPFRGRAHR